jgi:hypothetical protein
LPPPDCCINAPEKVNTMINDYDTSTAVPKIPSSVWYMKPVRLAT